MLRMVPLFRRRIRKEWLISIIRKADDYDALGSVVENRPAREAIFDGLRQENSRMANRYESEPPTLMALVEVLDVNLRSAREQV
jgi:hypothetical protein